MVLTPKKYDPIYSRYKASPGVEKLIEDLYSHIKNLIGLVAIAKCPYCDGSGAIMVPTMKSGSRQISETEFEQIQVEDFDIEQCQWCYEKSQILEQ